MTVFPSDMIVYHTIFTLRACSMARLGAISFDNRILDAARDGALVVFAGAGVSMGPPSNLPDFKALAADIAGGTNAIDEPVDRYLGRMHLGGIPVHKRAAACLSLPDSRPKALHRDLVRIFGTVDRVRIVTTNFDPHFGTAAQELFGQMPDLYRAPALPRGDDFSGIVHVHGALSRPADLVLTDQDFGRAYLTEGWARRFLVDVFRRYTVLFVGYSHDDVVMNYLARALPADSVAGRFALTDDEGKWKALGITPIKFGLANDGNRFRHLEEGVHRLAELASRGVLDWQRRLSELGAGGPQLDDEAADEVERGLREVHTTRFLLRTASDPQWLHWLGARGHLDALFKPGQLGERETTLLTWLTKNFVLRHPDELFDLVALKGVRMHPTLWSVIATTIGLEREPGLAPPALRRWIAILLAARPHEAKQDDLVWLAKRCARAGEDSLVLKVFLYLCQHDVSLAPYGPDAEGGGQAAPRRLDARCVFGCDVDALSELWKDHVKPTLPTHAHALLSAMTRSLEAIYRDLATWDVVSDDWDPHSYRRSAIEGHEQDRFPQPIDVLVDSARDALEHLAATRPQLIDTWLDTVDLQVPLLRRLAIHATTIRTGTTPDDRLQWVLREIGLAGAMEHHEVHRAVALSYPVASDDMRKAVVAAVLAIGEQEAGEWPAERMTDRAHFAWLSWLLNALPSCPYARAALTPIERRYPEWEPAEHPDFTHYSGMTLSVGGESPWPAQQLLATPAWDQLDQLLTFEGTQFFGPSRSGLLTAVTAACKQQTPWAFGLLAALDAHQANASDLWRAVLRGLREAGMSTDEWRALLAIAAQPQIQAAQGASISDLLYELVGDGGKPFASALLAQANDVAFATWQALPSYETGQHVADWASSSVDRSAGVLVRYWLSGLSLLMHGKSGDERHLPTTYKSWFASILDEPGSKGGHGRALLAGYVAFLYGLDEAWTREHVIPLFAEPDASRFAQAWDGFLHVGQLNPALAADMAPVFAGALTRIEPDARRRRRFIEFYTALAVYHVDDPIREMLPDLLRAGSVGDRVALVVDIGGHLRAMQAVAKKALWERWLRKYWALRLDAVGAPLDDLENAKMLDWLGSLGGSFAQGVELAVLAPPVVADHSGLLLSLREGDLPTQFPEATARLLIYLCDCVRGHLVADLGRTAARLPALPHEISHRLREQLARVGAA